MGTDTPFNADCIVIGSGFGGAAMACRVAEAGKEVMVLERGGEYPPGTFPRTPLAASTNLWDPSLGLFGMFDVWSFKKFEALVSSGVGGGSLIYANVMMRKPEHWFARQTSGPMAEYWPISADDLEPHYVSAVHRLGVVDYPYTESTSKSQVFRDAAAKKDLIFKPAPLAVRFSPDEAHLGAAVDQPADNRYKVQRFSCRKCGECDIGCNSGSKNSTDLTYLSIPQLRGRVHPHHEVREIKPLAGPEGGYEVSGVVHHLPDPRWERQVIPPRTPFRYTARTVVLAAGSFGSTYLLLRNRQNLPALSRALGTKFSGNGDYLGLVHAGKQHVVNSSQAPVITGLVYGEDETRVDLPWPQSGSERGYVIQDGGYPLLGDWLSEAVGIKPVQRVAGTVATVLRARLSRAPRTKISGRFAELIGSSRRSRTLLPVLGIGRDLPGGVMTLEDDQLQVSWDRSHSQPIFDRIETAMRRLAEGMDGEFHKSWSSLVSRMTSVHPLGGAPMATDPERGVVDAWGEVWNYPGLFVADGSVMPGSVGVNPALTIAALSERFSERVLQRC
jgi:cholesterol oxidase